MSEVTTEKKITQEELDQIKSLRSKYDEVTFKFGRLYIDKTIITQQAAELDKINDELDSEYESLTKQEAELMKALEEKYGTGMLDIETGTIKN